MDTKLFGATSMLRLSEDKGLVSGQIRDEVDQQAMFYRSHQEKMIKNRSNQFLLDVDRVYIDVS
ncbi:hypothetical protein ABLT15_01275 [Paraburkholderia tropica]|uniref:hypothetical protein n=1 Tax=Paraburkholderia tropica TaxID=92647 RepID=UPI0032B609E6